MIYRLLAVLAALILCAGIFAGLVWKGVIRLNEPFAERYPVRGADVSHYQGEVDFDRLAEQGLQFVFIKATEGSSHVDARFSENLARVQTSPLRYGFYHFFSYDSAGIDQAAQLIAHVPVMEDMLPPVIDVEFYGDYTVHPAEPEAVRTELRAMIDALAGHYQTPPILYCTRRAWQLYIRDNFDDCDLWIRDVYFTPSDCPWTFWQYTDRAVLDGYSGDEPCIDLNVFSGTPDDFRRYP